MNQTKWTQNNLFGTLDAVISHLDEWGACGVMVQREDLETWRDTVRQLKEDNRKLHKAIKLIVGVCLGEHEESEIETWIDSLSWSLDWGEYRSDIDRGKTVTAVRDFLVYLLK